MRNLVAIGALLASAALITTPAMAQDAAAAPAAQQVTAGGAPAEADPGSGSTTTTATVKKDSGLGSAEPAKAPEAVAAAEPTPPFALSMTLAGVSDYRFRGISLTNLKPAFQPSVTLTHSSGLHVGAWGSNLAHNDGDSIELDLVAGYGKTIGPITFDVSATEYVYPGVRSINYVEFIGTASHAFGNFTLGGTFAYTPRQRLAAPTRGIYGAVNAAYAIPTTPLTLTGSFGIEDNGFYDNKKDWSFGISAELAGFTVGAAYVDSAHNFGDPHGRGRAVFSISRSFSS